MKALNLAARSLRRELRQRDVITLALALVLAVLSLGAVATLGERVERSIVASAAELIGGDVGVAARHEVPAELQARAQQLGLRASLHADFPNVLFANDRSQLADVRAADAAYPLLGELRIRDGAGERVAHAPPPGEVYVEHRLLAALDLKLGDALDVGERKLRVSAEILREPGGSELFSLAPRALIALPDARASGLLGPGSRARFRLMVAGAADAVTDYTTWLKAHLPQGAELVTVEQAQQSVRNAFERSESFLRLAALLAALLSGIAVALAAQRYARRKTDEVALLRCLGASRGEVFASTTLVLVLLALPACLAGALLGLGLQQVVFALARDLLPAAAGSVPLQPSAIAFAIGIAVLFGFALPPLLRLREVPPVRVFQRAVGLRPRRFDALYLLPVIVSAALIYVASSTLTLATVLAVSLSGVCVFALVCGALLIRFVRALRTPGALRFGIANLARRRGVSLLQITALALALTALDLLAIVGPSLLASWRAELPADTPNYFLINLQPGQREAVLARLAQAQASNVSAMPMAVGKLVAINGKPPVANDYEDRRAAGWIRGETRLSWSAELPPTNRVIAGHWFEPHPSGPEVSIDEMWVEMFHLKIGDTLTLRIGDRDISARVTSVRGVRWDSFRVNFFLLLDPASGSGLAHSVIASFHLDSAHAAQLAAIARDYPALSLIDINALLDRVREIVGKVSRAATAVLGFSLAAGILVLFAALAASAEERRFESALLRTLGAGRRQIRAAVLGEFAIVGALAALIAAIGAGGAGMWLARRVFRISGYLPPVSELGWSVLVAALLIAGAGLIGLRRVTQASPLLVLRRA
jgi:putative ABC transport system permease protein